MLNLNSFVKKDIQNLKAASSTGCMVPLEQQGTISTSKKSFSTQVIYGNNITQPALVYKSSIVLYPDIFMTSSNGMFRKVLHMGGLFYIELNTL